MVSQAYDIDASKEYVIKGNSVIVKCQFPSFVADFLRVVSWETDKGDIYYPGDTYGTYLYFSVLTQANPGHNPPFFTYPFDFILTETSLVVMQSYDTNAGMEYAIRGNAIVLKCQLPSYVADFVTVVSWHTDKGEDFFPSEQYGKSKLDKSHSSLVTPHSNLILHFLKGTLKTGPI